MLDIKFIRENSDKVRWALKIKKIDLDLDEFLALIKKRVALLREVEELRRHKNENAECIKIEPGNKDTLISEGRRIKAKLAALEDELAQVEAIYHDHMIRMPTVPAPDTPIGQDDSANVEVVKWGTIPHFDFRPKDHIEIGRELDLLDLERGAKVGGYRGYYVTNEGVTLQMGIMMYALQKAIQKGFRPVIPPTLVKEFVLFGSGYFKGKTYNSHTDEIYKIANAEDKLSDGSIQPESKFLTGTAEPSLLAYYANEILDVKELPVKLCGFSQCYRSEIGSYGKDVRGIYRVHEFMKVELVCMTTADITRSDQIHEELIAISRELHEDLNLPYRQSRICSGDLSPGKYKQYDIEAWIPSRNGYGETGSASNFLDWQARRLNVRYRDNDGKVRHVYMLNDTALPSPRILISILENYQEKDGSVRVPHVLQPYLNGLQKITPKKS